MYLKLSVLRLSVKVVIKHKVWGRMFPSFLNLCPVIPERVVEDYVHPIAISCLHTWITPIEQHLAGQITTINKGMGCKEVA